MRKELRHVYADIPDSLLGYQWTAVNADGKGPEQTLTYPETGIFNWTVGLSGLASADIGGIPAQKIRVVQPSADSVERIDRSKDYTVKWNGPNNSVDLVISEIIGSSLANLRLKIHYNFQRATSDTAVVSSDRLGLLFPGLYLFTFSTATETPSEIHGIPVVLRIASVHNVVVRLE